jgi:hypothetical protein
MGWTAERSGFDSVEEISGHPVIIIISRDSSVGIATGYGMDGWEIRV